jgi:hypothetical protein
MRALLLCVLASLSACIVTGPLEPREQRDLFESCAENSECASGRCHAEVGCIRDECRGGCEGGSVCADYDVKRVCEAPAARGEDCLLSESGQLVFDKDCVEDLVCERLPTAPGSVHAVCVPATNRATGETCISNNECAGGICHAGLHICQSQEGEPCEEALHCATGSCGPLSVCVLLACSDVMSECVDEPGRYCSGGVCGARCEAARVLGEVCFVPDDDCPQRFRCEDELVCDDDTGLCVPGS